MILRSKYEGARQMAREIAKTKDFANSCKLRKKVEMLFAHLKRILGLRRLGLRGPNGANDDFLSASPLKNSQSSSLADENRKKHEGTSFGYS